MAVFKRDKKRSAAWHELKKLSNSMIKSRRQKCFEREVEKLAQSGSHTTPYKVLRALSMAERPPNWLPAMIKPLLTEQELADDLADYFAKISEEFRPENI